MFKITTHKDGARTIFELEGRLAGPWVDELKDCWQRAQRDGEMVTIALTQVSYVDSAGKSILTEMHRHGAELVAEGCMVKAIIEEIKRGVS